MQTYKCVQCGHKFQNKRRGGSFKKALLKQYVWQRQTYADLAEKYGKSKRWVQTKLNEDTVASVVKLNKQSLVIVADSTFFSHADGLTVFREPNLKKNVWWQRTIHERAEIYLKGKDHLEKNGYAIQAVVLDGRRGIRELFHGLPVQMCHFHQKQIVKRYLTTKPKLEASRALKTITDTLPHTNEPTFIAELSAWHETWQEFLKQKTIDPNTGRWFYTHKKVRAAYRSLKTNLPYLFTYQKYPELNIPNTTNSLDGFFNRLKSLIYVHRGLRPDRRMKMIVEILKGRNG